MPATVFSGLAGLDSRTVATVVEEMIGATEMSTIAGRHVEDISKRLLDKARLNDQAERMPDKAATIRNYLEIDCAIAEAENRIAKFSSTHGMDLVEETTAFTRRCALIESAGESFGRARFQASFGRPLDYYTGFIFDIFDAGHDRTGPVCGGGRYDGLAERLGASEPVPAVGFSLWLDRLLGEDGA